MININEKLLETLEESEYFLISIIARYGKKSCPSNDVLCKKTRWGINKVQKYKKELISKGFLVSSKRWKIINGNSVRDSNEYVINTKLITKYNGNKKDVQRNYFDVVEIHLHDNEVHEFHVDECEVHENRVGIKVLKVLIIETKINIEEEREKRTLSLENKVLIEQVEELQTELFYLKTEAEKQRKKVAEKKESLDDSNIPAWKVEIESSQAFKSWSKDLKESFIEFCQHRSDLLKTAIGSEKSITNGTARQILKKTVAYLKTYSEKEVIECFEFAIEKSNTDFNPLFVKNKKEREIQDKFKNNGKQTNNNKQTIDDGLSYAERAMRERFGDNLLTNEYKNGSSNDNYQGFEQEF